MTVGTNPHKKQRSSEKQTAAASPRRAPHT